MGWDPLPWEQLCGKRSGSPGGQQDPRGGQQAPGGEQCVAEAQKAKSFWAASTRPSPVEIKKSLFHSSQCFSGQT